MKIMTFNIQHALDYKNRVIDIDLFADSIKQFAPDVCGLNEVRGAGPLDGYTDQTNALGDRLGYNRYFAEAIKVRGENPYGNAIVSRYPIVTADTVAIPDPEVKRAGGRYESRCVLDVTLDVDRHALRVLVCHIGLVDDEAKNAVKTLCDILDKTDTPVVLMGDFNLTPDNPILAPLFERLEDTDAYAETPGEYTFASYDPKIKIDYLLFRGLKCRSVETVSEVISDHFPIIAEFEFDER